MALYMLLFDRPADLDATGYRERSRSWIAELVRLDGFQEFSAHWNALDMSPNTMALIRLVSAEAAVSALTNPAIIRMFEDMKRHWMPQYRSSCLQEFRDRSGSDYSVAG